MRVYPFIFLLLISCTRNNQSIKIKGSDTEVNLAVQLAETFHKTNPSMFISISGGGSGLGIASLLNGTGDIANSSRNINTEEIDLFNARNLQIDSFVFAQDAIAFIVSEELPIDSVSTADLAKILEGTYKDWSAITGKALPVNIYGRQSNSGTHEYIKTKLKIDFTPFAKQMNGNAQILEAIRSDRSGIGYVGSGYVNHGGSNGIKVLSIYHENDGKAISPLDKEMIAAGKYYFQRPLFQYFKIDSYNKISSFLMFENSDTGQEIIKSAGYYPAKSIQ
jgi:phosphate transport system substrate-binding protein